MISSNTLSLTALLVMATQTLGAAVPTAPGPGAVFNAGTPCPISWTADTTGTWTNASIQFMTGSNLAMSTLSTVASGLDMTKLTTYSWTCPEVNPNAPIYFYQFQNNGDPSTDTWTTRFTIASDSGAVVAAPQSTQPNGQAIPWGTGALASGSSSSSSSSNTTTSRFATSVTHSPTPGPSTTTTITVDPSGHLLAAATTTAKTGAALKLALPSSLGLVALIALVFA